MKAITNPYAVLLIGALALTLTPLLAYAQTDRTAVERIDRSNLHINTNLGGRGVSPRFIENEIIVQFAGNERPERIRISDRSVTELLEEYSARDDVEYAEPNYIAHAFFIPNDPYYDPFQWNFDNSATGGVHAEAAWDISTGGGIIIAVVDTGVAYENYQSGWFNRYAIAPDLAGTHFVQGYDFINNDSHPNDDEGHGTHVAGTIAGTTNNNDGVAGLAFDASIMPVKVLNNNGSGSYADVADGIRYAADNGADVINLSLGGPTPAQNLEDAVCYAKSQGVTVVAASGNNGASSVSYPAAYNDCVIAVGATRYNETRAPYSNTGSALDLVAPGGDTSVDQNGDGYGDGILQQTFGSNPRSFGYYFYQGTSMATPHIAAAAALVLANGNASTPDEVQSLLQETADDLGASGRDNTFGHGLINVAAALGETPPPSPPPPEPEPETNEAPTADAGPDQTIEDSDGSGSELVTLDGTGSFDNDGVIALFEWHEGATLVATGSSPIVDLPVGTHSLVLTVTDDEADSDTDTVLITVESPPPPPPPPGTTIFEDGFEDDLDLWNQDSQEDWKDSGRETFEGDEAAQVDGRATNAQLISPNFNLGGTDDVRINFAWFIERSFDSGEYIRMDISTDGGNSWTEMRSLRGNVDAENVWHAESFVVSGITQIQIRFRGTASRSSEDGYVDAVQIQRI